CSNVNLQNSVTKQMFLSLWQISRRLQKPSPNLSILHLYMTSIPLTIYLWIPIYIVKQHVSFYNANHHSYIANKFLYKNYTIKKSLALSAKLWYYLYDSFLNTSRFSLKVTDIVQFSKTYNTASSHFDFSDSR